MAKVIKGILLALKTCRGDLRISQRKMENLKLVAENSRYSKDLTHLNLTRRQQKKICDRQLISQSTLDEYLKSFNIALFYLGGTPDLSRKTGEVPQNGRIGTRYLILTCLESLGIRSRSDLHRFRRREMQRCSHPPHLTRPARHFFEEVLAS